LTLNGIKIQQVDTLKYLGVKISDDDKNGNHITRHKKAAYGNF